MTHTEFDQFFDAFSKEQAVIMTSKGRSYAGTADVNGDKLANFKRVAAAMGVTPGQAWLCYFLKHVDSVCTFVRTGHESEGPRGRLLDIANYATLGAALFQEREGTYVEDR